MERIDETSPLLPPNHSANGNANPNVSTSYVATHQLPSTQNQHSGSQTCRDRPWNRDSLKFMATLTIAMLGLQIVWSVEAAFASPFMLSIGLSKNALSIVLIAGPLSGFVVQPSIGAISDRLRQRKPFILGGAIATVVSLVLFPLTEQVAWAVFLLIILDCAINTMQAGIRAFIVDNAPTHQQERANAWASRMSGAGNILGFFFGANDWSGLKGSIISHDQFQNMSLVASVVLLCSIFPPLTSIREQLTPASTTRGKGMLKEMWISIRHLPSQVKAVCYVQLAAWVGWFLILFYTTTYVGEIYVSSVINDNMSNKDIDDAYKDGTKKGAGALLVFAITSLAASVLLPFIVTTPKNLPTDIQGTADANAYATTYGLVFTLRNTWIVSHVAFALTTLVCIFFVHDTTGATMLIGFIGIPWAMTLWAPFALIAAEINRLQDLAAAVADSDGEENVHGAPDGDRDVGRASHVPQAGIVLGIHNVAIAAPQVVSAILSSVVFRMLEKPRGTAGDESVAWAFRMGGLFAIAAAILAFRVREKPD